ncbi:hypothetical protein CERSUDRAFT_97962 [Gelatoporia subvermispora B]|uniref:Uncharacterized protein n=1 Tax=Ceriporiopsis subvermispora (strain B) TaxID=914234 RepID=M2R6U5_CERS8|nr:hypothetical protein CERSUDRAFT_97962 [Gelatoporia subvermispora B]
MDAMWQLDKSMTSYQSEQHSSVEQPDANELTLCQQVHEGPELIEEIEMEEEDEDEDEEAYQKFVSTLIEATSIVPPPLSATAPASSRVLLSALSPAPHRVYAQDEGIAPSLTLIDPTPANDRLAEALHKFLGTQGDFEGVDVDRLLLIKMGARPQDLRQADERVGVKHPRGALAPGEESGSSRKKPRQEPKLRFSDPSKANLRSSASSHSVQAKPRGRPRKIAANASVLVLPSEKPASSRRAAAPKTPASPKKPLSSGPPATRFSQRHPPKYYALDGTPTAHSPSASPTPSVVFIGNTRFNHTRTASGHEMVSDSDSDSSDEDTQEDSSDDDIQEVIMVSD